MANEAAAHREFAENLLRKHRLFGFHPNSDRNLLSLVDEAVRTALEKAAQICLSGCDSETVGDVADFGGEGCHQSDAAAIRSIVLRAEDVREG